MGSPAFHETVDITGLFNKSYSYHVNSLPKSFAISRTKMQRNSDREGMNIIKISTTMWLFVKLYFRKA